jgi:hypothetical protein
MSRLPANDLERELEKAFNFRGHVTLTLDDGATVEGYVFNRELGHPKLKEPPFVELFRKGSGAKEKVALARIKAITLSGVDHAAIAPPPPNLKK